MNTSKTKICPICNHPYFKQRPGQKVCGPRCAVENARRKQKKILDRGRKAEAREARDRLKTRGEWVKEAQKVFNAYIRERDRYDTCISCDRDPNDKDLITGSRWDCGHWLSVGAHPELRFNEDNAHKQCAYCNNELSGNHSNYRRNLIKKIGLARVEALEGPQSRIKLTVEDIKDIKQKYKKKLRELKKCDAGAIFQTVK